MMVTHHCCFSQYPVIMPRRSLIAAIGALLVVGAALVALSVRPEWEASLVQTRASTAGGCPPTNAVTDAPEVTVTIGADGKVADWTPAVAPFRQQLVKSIGAISALLRREGVYDMLAAKLPAILAASGPYADEMTQVAQVLGLELIDVVGYNVLYELAGGCTSIVANAQGAGTATLLHGRNLDYSSFGGLETTTIKVHFANEADGAVAFSCATFAGYVGCLTGVRAGRFSVSLNQRYVQVGAELVLSKNFAAAFPPDGGAHGVAFAFFLRDALRAGPSYAEAFAQVLAAPFVLGAYVTVGGIAPGEGAVIYAGRRGEQGLLDGRLFEIGEPSGKYDPCTETFCLQTNYDSLEDAAARSPAEAYRFEGGRANLQAAMPTLSPSTLLSDVLKRCPSQTVDDASPTLYSAVMEARTGLFHLKKTVLAAGPAAAVAA